MTSAGLLLCVLVDLERTEKINQEIITEELNRAKAEQDDYRLGYSRGRIDLCVDLIRFIKNNVEVHK